MYEVHRAHICREKYFFANKRETFANECVTFANKRETFDLRETFRIYIHGNVSHIGLSVSFFVINHLVIKIKYKLFWFYRNRNPKLNLY